MTWQSGLDQAQGLVISIIGTHAGKGIAAIFERKQADIERAGHTLWAYASWKARPQHVQALTARGPVWVAFVEAATPGAAPPRPGRQSSRGSGRQMACSGRVLTHAWDRSPAN